MVRRKKKKQVISGGLSTSEKLVSKNPAIREEGQRETANIPQREDREATLRRASAIPGKGFAGTLTDPKKIKGPSKQQVAQAFLARGEETTPQRPVQPLSPIPVQGAETPAAPVQDLTPLVPTPAEPVQEQQPGFPLVSQEALTEGIVDPNLVSQQVQPETPAPENFARDVAIGTSLGIGALAAGSLAAPVLAGIATDGAALAASGGLISKEVAKVASGGTGASSLLRKPAMNTKNAARIISFVGKIAKQFKSPSFIAGALGSYIFSVGFSFNEGQGDVATTLGIAMRDAIKNGDLEGAEEIKKQLDDLNSASNIAKNFIPFLGNYLIANHRKVQSTQKLAEQQLKKAQSPVLTQTPQQQAQQQARLDEETRQDERFQRIREENQARKLAEEARQDKRFARIRERNKR